MALHRWWMMVVVVGYVAAQVPPASKVAIPLQVTLDRSGATPKAIVRWRHDPEYRGSYTILFRRRYIDSQFSVYDNVTATDSTVTYTFDQLEPGTLYEVGVLNQLTRTVNNQQLQFTAAGYACIGIDVPTPPIRGRILLVIDSSVAEPLAAELAQLEQDLDREGWRVARTLVPRAERFDPVAVRRTKDSIRAWYERGSLDEPAAALLIGRVAVPYAGLYYQGQFVTPPDGHPDHRGAWPCDGYYGCIDEYGWSDDIADTAGVSRPENRNLPGDGKFDNALFPSPLSVRIGRVDFFNLPRLTPQGSTDRQTEIALLRDYFARNHAYRTGQAQYRTAALIDDNFKSYPELFSRSGWISFPQLVGSSNVREEKWFPTLDTATRLFAYGCGPGSYTSAGGIGGLNEFSSQRVRAVFTMLFGSYFGDWDSQNNLMRIALARGALTCSWSGRPVWYLHPMAAGETIGDIALMVQNFSPFVGQSVYVSSYGQGFVHVALLGDPTLRVRYGDLPAPRSLSLRQDGRNVHIEWLPPENASDIVGYHLYRILPNGQEQAVTDQPITATSYTDRVRVDGTVRYRVRAVGRIQTPSCTFLELSPPVSGELTTTGVAATADEAPLTVTATPNPATNFVTLSIQAAMVAPLRVEVYSLDGRRIALLYEGASTAVQSLLWQPRGRGVYFVVAICGDQRRVVPVLVE